MLLICWHMLQCYTSPYAVVTLAWHTGPHKIRSQICELTCEAWHVYIRRGLGANVGIFLGRDLTFISPLYITLRFDTCVEHLNICRMQFEYIIEFWALWCDLPNFAML